MGNSSKRRSDRVYLTSKLIAPRLHDAQTLLADAYQNRLHTAPIRALICAENPTWASEFGGELTLSPYNHFVQRVETQGTLENARTFIRERGINTIFIEPTQLGLEECTELIIQIRSEFPEVMFVLLISETEVAEIADFYTGERTRFKHYLKFDTDLLENRVSQENEDALKTRLIDILKVVTFTLTTPSVRQIKHPDEHDNR